MWLPSEYRVNTGETQKINTNILQYEKKITCYHTYLCLGGADNPDAGGRWWTDVGVQENHNKCDNSLIHTITMNDNSTVALVTNNSKYSLRYNTEWKDFRYYKKTSTGSNIPDISLYRFAYTKAVSILPVVTIRDTLCHDEDYTIDGEDKQSCVGREYDKASGQRQHPHISNLCTVMPVCGK